MAFSGGTGSSSLTVIERRVHWPRPPGQRALISSVPTAFCAVLNILRQAKRSRFRLSDHANQVKDTKINSQQVAF